MRLATELISQLDFDHGFKITAQYTKGLYADRTPSSKHGHRLNGGYHKMLSVFLGEGVASIISFWNVADYIRDLM